MKMLSSASVIRNIALISALVGIVMTSYVLIHGNSIYASEWWLNLLIFSWVFSPFYISLILLKFMSPKYQPEIIICAWVAICVLVAVDSFFAYEQYNNPDPIFVIGLLIGPGVSILISLILGILLKFKKQLDV